MIQSRRNLFVTMAAISVAISIGATLASGEDFRVDNTVYAGDEKEPTNQSTTIFRGGVVYDCLKTPAETVVYDFAAGRFVLLNLAHRTRSEVTVERVEALIDNLRPLAVKSKDPVVKFFAEPKFKELSGENADELKLSSPLVDYRLTLARQTDSSLVEQYREFCDWSARLNAVLVPGSRPPFGRLIVNAAVAKRQAVASKVLLTFTAGKGMNQPRTSIRSEHRLVSPLEPADLERVAETRGFMDSFKFLNFDKYRKTKPQ